MYPNSNLYRNRALTLILTGLALALCLPAQVGLGLAPMRLEMRLAPGQQRSGALTLTNESYGKSRIRTELLGFFIDSSGTPQFGRSLVEAAEYSCEQWLAVNPMEIELAPNETTTVRYTIRVPQEVSNRGFHCAAGFSTLPTAGQIAQTGIKTAVRIVAAFYVIVGNPQIEAGFKEITIEQTPEAGHPWRAVVVMQNYSQVHFRPAGNLVVLNAEDKVVETASFLPLPVLPKQEQRFFIPLKVPLAPGNYTLRARVDIGNPEIEEGTAVVAIPGPKP